MRIAIASGKGGTGKTTVAVNLALACPQVKVLADCDVEEPNCQLFVASRRVESQPITVRVPRVDESLCDGCGECGRLCQFKAIVSFGTAPVLFPELCHACGGCARICPQHAIELIPHPIGTATIGQVDTPDDRQLLLVEGRLNVGHPMPTPLIRAVRRRAAGAGLTLIDCPPGTACAMVAAVVPSDFAVLVTEPTPFGLHDLRLAIETLRQLHQRFGVVVNRAEPGQTCIADLCADEGVPLLAELPDDRRVAEAYSRGVPAVIAFPDLAATYRQLLDRILTLAARPGKERHVVRV